MRRRILIVCLFLLAPFAAGAESVKLKPEDFAYGLSLSGDGPSSLHEFHLTPEIYRGVVRPDLGDLRVFNKAGDVVPYAIRHLEAPAPAESRWEPMGLFPLYEGADQSAEKLSLIIRRESKGGRDAVDVTTGGRADSKKIVGYLMDGSKLPDPVKALTFDFSGRRNFIRKIDLDASDDLRTWRNLADGVVITHMNQDGKILSRNRVEFPPVKAAYFRLSWRDGGAAGEGADDPDIEGVNVELDPGVAEIKRAWIEVSGILRDGEAVFDAEGFFPADRAEILLAEPSVMIDSEITSSVTLDGPRTNEYSGAVFRLRRGTDEATTGPIVLKDRSDGRQTAKRYWFLKPRNAENALSGKLPTLRLGWVPERLVFVAQGEGPYLLAYGHVAAGPADFGVNALGAMEPAAARNLGEVILGGPSKLVASPQPPQKAWKKTLTVSLMGLATLGLGFMAYRLIRQMGAPR